MDKYLFTHGDHVKCPHCGHLLTCTERNHHGCSVDNAVCEKCGRGWQLSFKMDKVMRAPAWDDESEERRLKREAKERKAANRKVIQDEKAMLKILKEKYESSHK